MSLVSAAAATAALAASGVPDMPDAPAALAVQAVQAVQAALRGLRAPVGVFDAGIGSYALVRLIQQRCPWQDVIYLADRASFPYGGKTPAELAHAVEAAMAALARWGAAAVVLASNAPSVMVLDAVRPRSPVPVLGVLPPVREALARSRSGQVALLGVASLAGSPQIADYVAREAQGRPVRVLNASPLVELVESGAFLSDPAGTQAQVSAFMQALRQQQPGLDVCTLSSTHLPWLRPFFEQAAPGLAFLDPAQTVVDELAARLPAPPPEGAAAHAGPADGTDGVGRVVCLATASPAYPLAGLQDMLARLGVSLPVHAVQVLPAPLPAQL